MVQDLDFLNTKVIRSTLDRCQRNDQLRLVVGFCDWRIKPTTTQQGTMVLSPSSASTCGGRVTSACRPAVPKRNKASVTKPPAAPAARPRFAHTAPPSCRRLAVTAAVVVVSVLATCRISSSVVVSVLATCRIVIRVQVCSAYWSLHETPKCANTPKPLFCRELLRARNLTRSP